MKLRLSRLHPVRKSGPSSKDREPETDHPESHWNSEFDRVFREVKDGSEGKSS